MKLYPKVWNRIRSSLKTAAFYTATKKKLLLTFFSVIALAGGFLLLPFFLNHIESHYLTEGEVLSFEKETVPPQRDPPPSKKATIKIRHILEKDDTLFDVLTESKIAAKEIYGLSKAAEKIYDLGKIKPGNTLELEIDLNERTLHSFSYEIDGENILVIERTPDGFVAGKEEIEYETRLSVKEGVIVSSLFETIAQMGLDSQLALDLLDIYAWDIDFYVDIREGDRFKILFEQKYRDGNFVKNGRILCGKLINQGETFWAALFQDEGGHVDYYDLQQNSLRKQFLKSPLRYKYISSGYSKRRFHPILKKYRPHLGVDYAAPTGTPVVAVADGRVVYARWNKGLGRVVKIKHNSTFTTLYGHLSRFSKGIRSTKYVKQGQVIGYVGSSGLSTGPHLHYTLMKNGRSIDPLRYNFPSASPVQENYIADFELVKGELLSQLRRLDPATIDRRFAQGPAM